MQTNPKLAIRETGKYGKGVYATKTIEKGEWIHAMKGVRMSLDEFIEKMASGQEREDDPLQVGRKTYIDLDDFSRCFNHGCDPNAGLRKTCEMFAIRRIETGEEVVYDYSSTVAPTAWEMRCECGSEKCRKILGDILSVPPNRLATYKQNGALQRYMRALLQEVESGVYRIPAYELAAIAKLKR